MFGKTVVLEGLEKSLHENVFSSVPLKQFELSNSSNYNYNENWLHR